MSKLNFMNLTSLGLVDVAALVDVLKKEVYCIGGMYPGDKWTRVG